MSIATMEKIVNLCKSRGFVYSGSEIYGGLANSWDYGPLGIELKNNIKKEWLKKFVQENEYNVAIDTAILMNPEVWAASGHLKNFSDPLIDCKFCKSRYRADKLLEEIGVNVQQMTIEQINNYIKEKNVKCPKCEHTDFTNIRQFNLMFRTFQGVTEDSKSEIYLRPETAQGIFINFMNVQRTTRKKIPFGIAQIGKSFRNEITPGNFTFRTREFEQMELEFFCKSGTDVEWFEYWKNFCQQWLFDMGINVENLRVRNHEREELAHYSKATSDIEYRFPFGWGELWGIANRTDFDLATHQKHSGKSLEYFDAETNQKYIPYVIEPSVGVDRLMLAILCDAYSEETINEKDSRIVLKLHPKISPYKACVLPLSKKLSDNAKLVYKTLSQNFMTDFDENGSIGKRYRRQDEIGTPFCVTYDFDSLNDNCVTIRDRDSMSQCRVEIAHLTEYIRKKINNSLYVFQR